MSSAARKLGVLERLRIARCLHGVCLACGCRAGIYETTDDVVLTIIDDPDDRCPDRAHQTDFVIADVNMRAVTAHGEVA